MRHVFLLYGIVCYAVFFGTFVYAFAFVGDIPIVPRTISAGGPESPVGTAILINVALLGLFGIQHSLMARPFFKKPFTRIVPTPIERSTYVLASSAVMILMFWQWRPMPEAVWAVEAPVGRYALFGLFGFGWLLVLYTTFLIDHFDLFGLRQVVLYWRGIEYTGKAFVTPSLYKYMRHPLYLGWLVAFWAHPVMTQSHLLFAMVTTAYIFFAIVLEERDLMEYLGEPYVVYRRTTSMIVPLPRRTEPTSPSSS